MPYKQSIELKVMTNSDFAGPARLLMSLVLLSALLSPYPFLLIVAILFVSLVMWKLNILSLFLKTDLPAPKTSTSNPPQGKCVRPIRQGVFPSFPAQKGP